MSQNGMSRFNALKGPVTAIVPPDAQMQCKHGSFTWRNGVAIWNQCQNVAQLLQHWPKGFSPRALCTSCAVNVGAVGPLCDSHDEP
jgi:hypothetical protein